MNGSIDFQYGKVILYESLYVRVTRSHLPGHLGPAGPGNLITDNVLGFQVK